MQLRRNSDLPTCDAATITILLTFGSLNASIGSLRYGVRAVRHGPASAELSGDSFRYFSAHSATVRSSGGAKFLTAGAMAAFSLLVAVCLDLFKILPTLAIAHALLIRCGIVLIIRKFVQNDVHLLLDAF